MYLVLCFFLLQVCNQKNNLRSVHSVSLNSHPDAKAWAPKRDGFTVSDPMQPLSTETLWENSAWIIGPPELYLLSGHDPT